MNPDHFAIKQRSYNVSNYKYIFSQKHYEVMAKYCATLLIACNESNDAHKAVRLLSALFESDNSRFKPELFGKRIGQLLEEANTTKA